VTLYVTHLADTAREKTAEILLDVALGHYFHKDKLLFAYSSRRPTNQNFHFLRMFITRNPRRTLLHALSKVLSGQCMLVTTLKEHRFCSCVVLLKIKRNAIKQNDECSVLPQSATGPTIALDNPATWKSQRSCPFPTSVPGCQQCSTTAHRQLRSGWTKRGRHWKTQHRL